MFSRFKRQRFQCRVLCRGDTRGTQIYVWGIDKDNFNIYLEKFKVFITSVIWHANSMQSGESWYQKNYTTCDSPIITWMTDNILSFWQNAALPDFYINHQQLWAACDIAREFLNILSTPKNGCWSILQFSTFLKRIVEFPFHVCYRPVFWFY